MRKNVGNSRWLMLAVALGLGVLTAYLSSHSPKPVVPVNVAVPAHLSQAAIQGQEIFVANCQKCHGPDAAGSEKGPPLVHRFYAPNHHADISFLRAAEFGVKAHHWQFGDMARVPGVSKDQVALVVQYVRELQRANGIQ